MLCVRVRAVVDDLLFPHPTLHCLQLLLRQTLPRREVTWRGLASFCLFPNAAALHWNFRLLTGSDLGINLHPRVCRDELVRQLNSLVNRDPADDEFRTPLANDSHFSGLPLANDGIMLHAVGTVSCRTVTASLSWWTHLLMLSMRSIFLMPSQ